MSASFFVTAVVGLSFEAQIAAGPGVRVLCRGAEGLLAAALEHHMIPHCLGVISFGIAGGLMPHLRPGSVVVASGVADDGALHRTDETWSNLLLDALPGARHAVIAGSNSPVAGTTVKQAIHQETGAIAVDMESHLAARLAAQCGLPFAAVRVIADPAHRDVPGAALAGLGPDGKADGLAVLRALAAAPSQTPLLMRVAVDVAIARAALFRSRQLLGRRFGIAPDGHEIPRGIEEALAPAEAVAEPAPLPPLLAPRFG